MKKLLIRLVPLVSLALFGLALAVLTRELRGYHAHDILNTLSLLHKSSVAWALLFTFFNYFILTQYDNLALRYIDKPVSYRKVSMASFLSYAFSNTLGFSLLSGGAVRYRLYSAWGLGAVDIAQVVGFSSLTLWLGAAFTAGISLLATKFISIPVALRFSPEAIAVLGAVFLIAVLAYLLWTALERPFIKIRDWEIRPPSFNLACLQIVVSTVDWILAGAVLYALLPVQAKITFPHFFVLFILAQVAGLLSQVPGGLGVFETMMVVTMFPALSAPQMLGSLLIFRLVYYLIPLIIATLIIGVYEFNQSKAAVRRAAGALVQWIPSVMPQIISVTTFSGGFILLLSGATPAQGSRLAWLDRLLPLPVMELSHFLGSLAGMILLLLAWGLYRRLDAAYYLARIMLICGAVFSLLKGLDYEEAVLLVFMWLILWPARSHFYRKTSLFIETMTTGWIVSVCLAFCSSIWLGFFVHKHLEFSNELWWQFTLHGDAPRFLRASVGAISLVIVYSITRLLRPAPPVHVHPTPVDLDKTFSIAQNSPKTNSYLALLGDKQLIFNDQENAFLMFGVAGRSWVAMGDPVGPAGEVEELAWRFRELCDQHGGWTVFYEVGKENLPLYLDLGLTILKVGEVARVPLPSFSLDGKAKKDMRNICNRVKKEGAVFEIIPPEEAEAYLPEFKGISDGWLSRKNTREKRFSLGYFEPGYLKHFPFAVVRKDGKIVAFANLWLGGGKEELSVDLMRHSPDAPQGVMEYLFIELMLWGKSQGYGWFNLGMAPFSGFAARPLAPLWNKLGAALFRRGEQFYNFQGLRQYKEKFHPVWEPQYLASPGTLTLPWVLANVASLISSGLKGVVAK